ncbi:DNA/RNA non-specific endonuclease [Teichococcus vastitatis]|uniref:DNA/RNA non-specific endonuclease n=1 Tax=Teichococcus vastitatis TaxID=2307076 RepID=UPI000E7184DA|nr:DNA/RNA non-specific endonuclease [Pseudoroseomonas vastitatis]
MARTPRSASPRKKAGQGSPDEEALRRFIRTRGSEYLRRPNVTSIGIGHKVKGGRDTGQLAIQFTVGRKLEPQRLEAEGLPPLPSNIVIEGLEIPTDVLERRFRPSWELVEPEQLTKDLRKQRLDPVRPGCSIAHERETAGTLGAIVYDLHDGAALGLSNWHVLQGPNGSIGDAVLQPGPFDDNRTERNRVGSLLRSHLGAAGDCAVVRLEERGAASEIIGLGVTPRRVARAALGDAVVKSGRTTGITHGRVTRIEVMVRLDYGGSVGLREIGGFEIGPDKSRPTPEGEISRGGDSGAAWMASDAQGRATDIMLGLHFAGESEGETGEHAIACQAHAALEKLDARLEPPAPEMVRQARGEGFDTGFLQDIVPLPEARGARREDVLVLKNGETVVHHTHFSLSMSRSRKLALWVAWNIDGRALKGFGRKGLDFRIDPEVGVENQLGDELYAGNRLDRGHLARRADLVWGPDAEARQANRDSFYFTNITPQHQVFNQSGAGGLWGELEEAIMEEAEIERLRLSVMAGPLLEEDDPVYRDARIPRAFWKIVAYRDADDGDRLTARAFIMTQENLLDRIETLELDPFRLFRVPVTEVERRTSLDFGTLRLADASRTSPSTQYRRRERHAAAVLEVRSRIGITM